ncbi:SCO6745 family protein [Nonomuraea sp. LPB2021202275-12-8]|uniref:SCO6745 family protein n=1 Tax=Nonomuraea sp. LPB2021202275-12-8 TaxID=3120159 RepID=UPI00300C2D19
MTPGEAVRRTRHVVTGVGAAFGQDPGYRARGRRLGLSRWPFYFGGRAGVLGDVGAEVVTAACGFFAPGLVDQAWETARRTTSLSAVVHADVEECVRWARTVYGGLAGLERLAHLTERVVRAAEPTGRPLFAAWRSHAVPAGDPADRVALALLRLREHRGGSHLIAVLACGLSPLTAILAGPGTGKAAANGWRPPWPALPPSAEAALDRAGRLTDELAAAPYASLTSAELVELTGLLDQVDKAYQLSKRVDPGGTER